MTSHRKPQNWEEELTNIRTRLEEIERELEEIKTLLVEFVKNTKGPENGEHRRS
jgi:hypothetical protein